MEKIKVLLTDIDGVFNHFSPDSTTTQRQTPEGYLIMTDPEKVFMLNNAQDLNGFSVVLSSTWRIVPNWREQMRANGFLFKFLDKTPIIKNGLRGEEIKAWLDQHPEVERYAILDDIDEFSPEQKVNFFKTDQTIGLTQEIMDKIVDHLK
jgi:hypothetical protein